MSPPAADALFISLHLLWAVTGVWLLRASLLALLGTLHRCALRRRGTFRRLL